MCGIVSVISYKDNVVDDVIASLKRLEYRGYDSAGIAFLSENSNLERIRSVGKVDNLANKIKNREIKARSCIGHTRWATHGKVTESNAHPHISDGVAIVHNGIIENYTELKNKLISDGFEFESETDSEVIAKTIAKHIKDGADFVSAFKKSIKEFVGTYAIVAIYAKEPNLLIGTKKGSPMAVGISSDGQSGYIASDAVALSTLAENLAYMEEGDIVVIEKGSEIKYNIYDSKENAVSRTITENKVSLSDVTKNGYSSFMLKEIFEESIVAKRTFDSYNYDIDLTEYKNVSIIACGTSYYAGMLAKYWIEDKLRIHVDVEVASEFRYRNPVLHKDGLYIFISQSGETIDTLYALRLVKEAGIKTLAIVNVATSSIAREADFMIKTEAGVEIGVASTKAFVSQIMALLIMSCGKDKVNINAIQDAINSILNGSIDFTQLAKKIIASKSIFYIGRGSCYPIALEGALKIKEISYLLAEGIPSGEIKHGPLALVDENVITIAFAPNGIMLEKVLSNCQEISARHGYIVLVTNTEDFDKKLNNIFCINMSKIRNNDAYIFACTTFIHLLAYHTATAMLRDVDKPRNLAKSVTVE